MLAASGAAGRLLSPLAGSCRLVFSGDLGLRGRGRLQFRAGRGRRSGGRAPFDKDFRLAH